MLLNQPSLVIQDLLSFVGANGIDTGKGFTTADNREAKIKDFMLRHSQYSFVVADGMKLGKRWSHSFGDIEKNSVITTNTNMIRNPEAPKVIEYLKRISHHIIIETEGKNL